MWPHKRGLSCLDLAGKGTMAQAAWPWQNFQDLNYKIRWDSGGTMILPTKTSAVRHWLLKEGCSTMPRNHGHTRVLSTYPYACENFQCHGGWNIQEFPPVAMMPHCQWHIDARFSAQRNSPFRTYGIRQSQLKNIL